jgi:uncharacterized protein YqeY
MSLKEQLVADLKVALQEKDASRALVIRYLRNAIQYREKDVGKELDEAAVMEILARQVRERRESIAAFEAGQRHDLVEKERAELAILEVYMPEQLSQDKILELAQEVVAEVGATSIRDKGKVMSKLMPQIRGKGDGNVANEIVTQLLSGEAQ